MTGEEVRRKDRRASVRRRGGGRRGGATKGQESISHRPLVQFSQKAAGAFSRTRNTRPVWRWAREGAWVREGAVRSSRAISIQI